jgi:hypothetical protein
LKIIIHVNRQILARNIKTGERKPAIIVRTYKGVQYSRHVKVGDLHFIQDEDNPLDCGAKVWAYIEGESDKVEIL